MDAITLASFFFRAAASSFSILISCCRESPASAAAKAETTAPQVKITAMRRVTLVKKDSFFMAQKYPPQLNRYKPESHQPGTRNWQTLPSDLLLRPRLVSS